MAITAWCVFDDIWCVLRQVSSGLLTDILISFFEGVMLESNTPVAPNTAHIEQWLQGDCSFARRKASDKSNLSWTYCLTLILSDGNFNTLVPQEQLMCIQNCNSAELLGTRYWNSSLQLLSVKWSAFDFSKWSTTLSFQQFSLLCFDLKVSNLEDCCSIIS